MFPGHSVLHFTADTSRLYEVLGVPKAASEAEIRKAYRKLAVRHHPDKGGDVEQFRELSRAYEVLNDPEKRLKYDEFGEDGLEANFVAPEPAAGPPEVEKPEPQSGGLAVGTCMLATLMSAFCGISTAAGVALCGAGRVLQVKGGSQHRLVVILLMACGLLLLWPLLGPLQGFTSVLWTAAMYGATLCGLAMLTSQWERLPRFLPYLLFAGYLLLFLLVPTRSAERVLVELPGYVVVADEGEVESDCALAESAALFTWGMVAIHRILAHASSKAARRSEGGATQGV